MTLSVYSDKYNIYEKIIITNNLEFDYFIAKTAIENSVEVIKGKNALKNCNSNFKENRYFNRTNLKNLKK